MTTTRTRSRGHTGSRASAARAGAERRPVIIASVAGAVILLAFAALATSIGHVVLAATDHFMMKYSGVFALVLLTGSAVIGVLATDRIILNPGHRVIAQAVHRAFAFGTLAFLVVHIVLEITAPHLEESKTLHVHVLDAFIPFLSQYRTFYMAEGTIASDIIILLITTGILRRLFTTNGNAWKWRAIHYSNYAALILGVLHGLLAGRKAIGTFVYWSYGVVILLLALAVMVRFLATSLRNKEVVAGAAPLAEKGGTVSSRSMPVRAAALGLMSQMNGAMPLGGATRAVPALQGGNPAVRAPYSAPYPVASYPAASYPVAPYPVAPYPVASYPAAPYPTAPYPAAAGAPQAIAAPPDRAQTGPGPAGPGQGGRMPRYEPGNDGPPRYEGAPAPRPGDHPGRWREPGHGTDPQPAYGTGPQPAHRTGPAPRPSAPAPARAPDRSPPAYGTGSQPAHRTGPQPVYDSGPQPAHRTGPQPVHDSGPQPAHRTGPQPVYDSGPQPALPDRSPARPRRRERALAAGRAAARLPGGNAGLAGRALTRYGLRPPGRPGSRLRSGSSGYGPRSRVRAPCESRYGRIPTTVAAGATEAEPRHEHDGYGPEPRYGSAPATAARTATGGPAAGLPDRGPPATARPPWAPADHQTAPRSTYGSPSPGSFLRR